MNVTKFAVIALAAVMVNPLFADDEATPKKKRRNATGARQNVAAQLIKQLDAIELSDEQKTKIKELGAKATEQMKAIRTEAGLTPAVQKKRAEVVKSMQDSELKGKQRVAAVNEKAGLNEEQAKALAKVNAIRTKFQTEVIAMLSDAQKEKLPQRLQRMAKAGKKSNQTKQRKAKNKSEA